MEIIIAILVAAAGYWFFILRPGRLDFWKVAAKHPDLAYDFFSSKDCWRIFENGLPADYRNIVPEEQWVGPFRLWVPKRGDKMVHIFGKTIDYEDSQNEFLNRIKSAT